MIRIAIGQIDSALGDFEGNRKKILQYCEEAALKKASLIVFPECSLFGYHPFDLLERADLVQEQIKQLKKLHSQIPKGMAVLVGGIVPRSQKRGRPFYNSAILLQKGKKAKFFHKTLLPTGDIFDEGRFIDSGDMGKNTFQWEGKRFLVTICEDIWAWEDDRKNSEHQINPIKKLKGQKFDLVLNMSASPWHPGKFEKRKYVTKKTAQFLNAPVLYVNMVGAQDEVIYDGRSFAVDKNGKVIFEGLSFEEQLNVFELPSMEAWSKGRKVLEIEEIRQALVLGIRDFALKNGIKTAHFGLSGGIDSSVVACLAVDALGPAHVVALSLPGPFTSELSRELAIEQARNLGVVLYEISILKVFDQLLSDLHFMSKKLSGTAEENLQARLRGLILMAYANAEFSMLLSTGNKSEYATGYSTLYGDMCGALAPIADLTKAQVYALAKHYNKQMELIPQRAIDRAPSAELRPNQKDQDSLPPYDLLDQSVVKIVEEKATAKSAIDKWLLQKIYATEFKRWQAPPILRASSHAFGRGRRYPISFSGKKKL